MSKVAEKTKKNRKLSHITSQNIADFYFKKCPYNIEYIPEEFVSMDMCIKAIKKKVSLSCIPKNKRTVKICALALHKDYCNIKFIPSSIDIAKVYNFYEKYRNNKILKKTKKQKSPKIKIVSAEKNEDWYYNALERDVNNFKIIPEKHMTDKILKKAIAKGLKLNIAPETKRTKELCYFALKKNVYNFEYIPMQHRTEEIYRIAIEKGLKLTIVPVIQRTKELCDFAFDKDINNIKDIPNEYKKIEMCYRAFNKNPQNIRYFLKEWLTDKLCKKAVRKGVCLNVIPEEFRSAELCFIAVDVDKKNIAYVPLNVMTRQWCKNLVKKDSNNIYILPEEVLTLELYSLTGNILDIDIFPNIIERLKTHELCKNAVDYNVENIKYVPTHCMDKEMCEKAFNANPSLVDVIPECYHNSEMKSYLSCRKVIEDEKESHYESSIARNDDD